MLSEQLDGHLATDQGQPLDPPKRGGELGSRRESECVCPPSSGGVQIADGECDLVDALHTQAVGIDLCH